MVSITFALKLMDQNSLSWMAALNPSWTLWRQQEFVNNECLVVLFVFLKLLLLKRKIGRLPCPQRLIVKLKLILSLPGGYLIRRKTMFFLLWKKILLKISPQPAPLDFLRMRRKYGLQGLQKERPLIIRLFLMGKRFSMRMGCAMRMSACVTRF